jgi:hypothetical protein
MCCFLFAGKDIDCLKIAAVGDEMGCSDAATYERYCSNSEPPAP